MQNRLQPNALLLTWLPFWTTSSRRSEPCLHNFLLCPQGDHGTAHGRHPIATWRMNHAHLPPPVRGACCVWRGKSLLAPCLLPSLHQLNSLSSLKAAVLKMGRGSEGPRTHWKCMWRVCMLGAFFDESIHSFQASFKTTCVGFLSSLSLGLFVSFLVICGSCLHLPDTSLLCNRWSRKYLSPLCSWHFTLLLVSFVNWNY